MSDVAEDSASQVSGIENGSKENQILPKVWIGLECTVNRVGENYFDQSTKNGHRDRLEDLSLFSSLGAEKIRYPFLWEYAERVEGQWDWAWNDERANELNRLGLTPIAGLLHHGSGPRFTDLADPNFPEKFANYAGAFAQRYPWIIDYTPINEILTTARFSGLYGHWYPHARNEKVFVKTLYNQVKATVLAMKAIRKHVPHARLIQTDDLGRCQSTPTLQYQARFENHRRWLGFDLLMGRVNPSHALYKYLTIKAGLSPNELKWLEENPSSPQVIGINHYHQSNRFLDHRYKFYPKEFHGGNKKHRYADVAAIFTDQCLPVTIKSLCLEAWQRYTIPIAITEVHLHSGRESQLQWFEEVWRAATELSSEGVPIIAVTAWSLLGSYDWNSLCTQDMGFYEPGVFDVRLGTPRPTALANHMKQLTSKSGLIHPSVHGVAWWKQESRIQFKLNKEHLSTQQKSASTQLFRFGDRHALSAARSFEAFTGANKKMAPLLIIEGTSNLGQAFARICFKRNLSFQLINRLSLDITNLESVRRSVQKIQPWAVVNAASFDSVEHAESEPELCFRENVDGPSILAQICASEKIKFLTFSSDFVFDGNQAKPYLESELVSPLNIYGQSKVAGEKVVNEHNPEALVVRTGTFFGPWDKNNFINQTLNSLLLGQQLEAIDDIKVSPTYVPGLVAACLDLLIDNEKGIFHITNDAEISCFEFATVAHDMAKKHPLFRSRLRDTSNELIIPKRLADFNFNAKRPLYSVLKSQRARILPSLEVGLNFYFNDLSVYLKSEALHKNY